MRKIRAIIFWILTFLLLLLAAVLQAVCEWFNMRFGVGFQEVLFTITSPLEGADVSFLSEAVEYVLPRLLRIVPAVAVGFVFACFFRRVIIGFTVKIGKKRSISVKAYTLYKLACLCFVFLVLGKSVNFAVKSLALDEYISSRLQKTTIYEDYYVDPKSAVIGLDGEPKNIIYIYMESMETTYASVEAGGAQEGVNYIPNLTQLAADNVSFSDTEKLGGAYLTTGSTWTMGALFSTTTGVPFSFPVNGNSMDSFEKFAPGITSMGEVLEAYGYNQVFLCGSDGNFAGRKKYFEQHGNYEVHDYQYAVEQGYIDKGYYVWWGYEDEILYEIAKEEILAMAEDDEPFNYTMLTVDTHHVDGYICNSCGDTYDAKLGNVLECADRQVYEFVQWCQEQDFYEDTVIIITGDHYRMDSTFVANKTRRLYNCIINSDKEPLSGTVNRTFTSLDIFPTTLSAMGFSIEGDRLGLGTDLFSGTETLAEQLGYEQLNEEVSKYSDYYIREFE